MNQLCEVHIENKNRKPKKHPREYKRIKMKMSREKKAGMEDREATYRGYYWG